MKKLKKPLSIVIIVALMAVMLTTTTTASGFVLTEHITSDSRATTASMTNGQKYYVEARILIYYSGGIIGDSKNIKLVSATTDWLSRTNESIVRHLGGIVY